MERDFLLSLLHPLSYAMQGALSLLVAFIAWGELRRTGRVWPRAVLWAAGAWAWMSAIMTSAHVWSLLAQSPEPTWLADPLEHSLMLVAAWSLLIATQVRNASRLLAWTQRRGVAAGLVLFTLAAVAMAIVAARATPVPPVSSGLRWWSIILDVAVLVLVLVAWHQARRRVNGLFLRPPLTTLIIHQATHLANLLAFAAGNSTLTVIERMVPNATLILLAGALHAAVVHESETDHLTRLRNRARGEQALALAHEGFLETGRPYAVILVDLDHFKRYNDTLGHAAGDVLLTRFGELLTAATRNSDLACRWGGEEFLLLLYDCRAPEALAVAERLRLRVEHARLSMHSAHPVTLSAGVAAATGESWLSVVSRADAALYRAKQLRNRVELA